MKTPNTNPTATSCAVSQEEKQNYMYICYYDWHGDITTAKVSKGLEFKKSEQKQNTEVYSGYDFKCNYDDIIYISANLNEFNTFVYEGIHKNILIEHE